MKSILRPLVLPLVVLALAAQPAAATTYMMMTDADLTDQAAVVVDAKVVGADYAPVADGTPATDYLIEVNRVLKGDLPGSTVVVRVPGGINPQGMGLKIWGAPSFKEGGETLLFLRPAKDGTYRILHMMLGAFHKVAVDGRTVAVRDLSEGTAITAKGTHEEGAADVARDFARFSEWIAGHASGLAPAADYKLTGSANTKALGAAQEKFTFLIPPSGNPIRWFVFDRGQRIQWRVHTSGQPGLGLQASIDAMRTGIDTWNGDGGSNIQYSYAGTTEANGGLTEPDGVNSITFDDPRRDDPNEAVEGTFSCLRGGVIAVGGPWFFDSTRAYRGRQYHEAGEADIITNDGTLCLLRKPSTAEEVFTHELGHTLGLGHSADVQALMFPTAHADDRGARLHPDDRAAVNELYFASGGGGGTPTNLVAPARVTGRANSSTQVTLTWRDKAKNEEGYSIEAKKKKGKWEEVLTVDANSTSAVVTDLTPGTVYSFRVRAVSSTGVSAYGPVVTVTLPRQ